MIEAWKREDSYRYSPCGRYRVSWWPLACGDRFIPQRKDRGTGKWESLAVKASETFKGAYEICREHGA